ncbi:RNA 2',3'-cyclic phosphodiesterase [Sphingomonas swuensis]|uniref:RNA 2',3'-cyclic phosphodiesterase n=1 Tax=Sphingomonas swuensis TaxID=977800 RepID=A0ABP7SYK3_9SPHN
MHRLFVALPVPESVADVLLDLMDDGAPLRWQEAEQLHLTLRFVGEVERPIAEDLARALATLTFQPFEIALSGVGRFAQRRGGALWCGIAPREPVAALAARIERLVQACGLAAEHRAFHPHITLARWNGAEPLLGPFLERHGGLRSAPWTVDRFNLVESRLGRHGPFYKTVASYFAG